MPKIEVKQDFTVPGHPQFTAGAVFNVNDTLARLAVERGLAEVVKPKKKTKAKEETKKTKKSNKVKDE